MTISAIVRSSAVPDIDGMKFELTVKVPYLTVVSPNQHQLLYRVYATSNREIEKLGDLEKVHIVYSEVEPIGFKV